MNDLPEVYTQAPPAPNGVFWSDHIKTLRDAPGQRLSYAPDNRPYPASYREALIALRAIIRKARKDQREHQTELLLMFGLAAESSFLGDTPYIGGIAPSTVRSPARRRHEHRLNGYG